MQATISKVYIFVDFPGNNSLILMKTIGEFRELISISVTHLVQIEFKGLLGIGAGMCTTIL